MFYVCYDSPKMHNGIWPTILLNKSVHRFEVYMELPCQKLYTMQPLRMHSISIIKPYFWQNATQKIVLHVQEMIFIAINAYSSNNDHNAHVFKTHGECDQKFIAF